MPSAPHKPRRARVLIVDDDPIVAGSIAEFLRAEGHEASTAHRADEALEALEQANSEDANAAPFGVVISDVTMPGKTGLELLREIGERFPEVVVLMLTGYGTIESAVEAVKLGAADYLTKPVIDAELRIALEKALRQQAILAENSSLRRQLDQKYGIENVVGSDHRMVKIFELVEAVAPSKTTVLMSGESGTGKSLLARAIHNRSPRAASPFVELSCGSIPETLLESELFGHAKGAFTGAHADKKGRFLAAHGGTLFLDEINSASPAMQLKLLRVLQEKKFEPVGSTDTIEVDVRVLLASNQPLEDLVAKGAFRQDLYYRINVVRIDLPPLRDRPGDIPRLAEHFLRAQEAELGRSFVGFSPEALDALRRYSFPGNIRELQNIVERATVLARSPTIGVDDLPPFVLENSTGALLAPRARTGEGAWDGVEDVDAPGAPWSPTPLEEAMQEPERRIILKALRANDWNRQRTADDLCINRTTLYKKMRTLGIDKMAG